MKPKVHPSVVAFFCEDIREEQSGTNSVIGILPDNMAVPQVPGVATKLGLYVRANFPVSKAPSELSVRLELPWEPYSIPIGRIEPELIKTTLQQAREQGNEAIGLLLKAISSPFPIVQAGRINVVAVVDKQEWLIGSLRITLASKPPEQAGTSGAKRKNAKRLRKRVPS